MPRGNPSPKIAVTIDPLVHDMAVARAKEQGVSLSAYITEAVRRRLMIEDGLLAMLEWELENAPLDPEMVTAAEREVDDAIAELEGKIRRRKRRPA